MRYVRETLDDKGNIPFMLAFGLFACVPIVLAAGPVTSKIVWGGLAFVVAAASYVIGMSLVRRFDEWRKNR